METPLHIDFQGMDPQDTLHAEIARHVAALEKRAAQLITSFTYDLSSQ